MIYISQHGYIHLCTASSYAIWTGSFFPDCHRMAASHRQRLSLTPEGKLGGRGKGLRGLVPKFAVDMTMVPAPPACGRSRRTSEPHLPVPRVLRLDSSPIKVGPILTLCNNVLLIVGRKDAQHSIFVWIVLAKVIQHKLSGQISSRIQSLSKFGLHHPQNTLNRVI